MSPIRRRGGAIYKGMHRIATVYDDTDAALFVAAPELLAALREIVNNLQEPCAVNQDRQQWVYRKLNETLYAARAAIAKAEGRQ